MIDPSHAMHSIRRQCALLGLHRSIYHREPASESSFKLRWCG